MLILRCKGSTSARLVAKTIGGHYYQYIPRRHRRDFIVNYGQRFYENRFGIRPHLNANLCTDKLRAFDILKGLVNIPEYWTNKSQVPDDAYPILGRRKQHTQGKDIIFIENKEQQHDNREFYVKYIPKIGEYRVHVLGDNATAVTKKLKDREDADVKVRSHDNGWKQWEYNGQYKDALSQNAVVAVKGLYMDFGAVDLIMDENHKIWVLEVNSAPGLCDSRLPLYINYFKEEEQKWLNRNSLRR